MNYTENYHLPQWEETDRIMRVDFNQMCADIESGLTAGYSPDNPLYAVGTYTGDGANQKITLGFRPSFVIASGVKEESSAGYKYMVMSGGHLPLRTISFEEDGFHVWNSGSPNINEPDRVYDYIAFR